MGATEGLSKPGLLQDFMFFWQLCGKFRGGQEEEVQGELPRPRTRGWRLGFQIVLPGPGVGLKSV